MNLATILADLVVPGEGRLLTADEWKAAHPQWAEWAVQEEGEEDASVSRES